VVSPDGKIVAEWYELLGGGAAGWGVDRVELRPASEAFKGGRAYSFSSISADPVKMRWISNSELELSYDRRGTVERSNATWKGVTIRYRAVLPGEE